MSDHAKLGWIVLLTIVGLLLYLAAFGDGLTPRPAEYLPIYYQNGSCAGLTTDITILWLGIEKDVRWAEIYVEDSPGHQQLVAVAAFGPGEDGILTTAEVLLPSGTVLRFANRAALTASPYAEVCAVAGVWLNRT